MGDDIFAVLELGLKPIHLACLEGNLETVIKLASEPSNIDAYTEPEANAEWRVRETPIELAALMGHIDIVEFLVQQGATLAHDGVHASSSAGNGRLTLRRKDYLLKTVKIGQEPSDALNTRKAVHDLLSSPGRRSVLKAMTGPRADLGFPDYKLAKQGRYIVVYTPVLRVKTDITLDRSKTIGVITAKGNGDVLMAAHSGFRLGGDRDEKCLDTNAWNYIALHNIATRLKFQFPGNRHDNGAKAAENEHRGRAHAGHVEVLLGAWYALEMTRKTTGNPDASLEWLLAHMHTLKGQTLGPARSAIIMIDSQPCATCLKFINRLFQYTGLHFSVKGAVGIGPTLATKDPRHNIRYDTFGDTFSESEGEGDDEEDADGEEESVVPETPTTARNVSDVARDVAGGASVVIRQTARNSLPKMAVAGPRFSPVTDIDEDDDGNDENINPPAVDTTPLARAAPITPARPRMQWPIPENRPRRAPAVVPFLHIPSRRPANPAELLAEYKKATPVWNWPGYEGVGRHHAQHQDQHQHQVQVQHHSYHTQPKHEHEHDAPPLTPPRTTQKSHLRGVTGEDAILVDLTDDSDSTIYTPESGKSGNSDSTLCRSTTSVNSQPAMLNRDGRANPVPLSRAEFLYSSFAPITREPGTSVRASQDQQQQQQQQQEQQPQRHTNSDSDSDVIMRSSDEGSADAEGYYYVPRLALSQRRPADEDGSGSFVEEREEARVDTPRPVPSAVRLQQWRYQPAPRPQRSMAQRYWGLDGQVRNRPQRYVAEVLQGGTSPIVEGSDRVGRGRQG
ncbi:hypothetical protein GGS26DRAFT_593415 [Hypomontagnella submonticulosa]|nr:hypothetical protein GGS26DRAFT_593415 [Hypomontagnella submonticulosa]